VPSLLFPEVERTKGRKREKVGEEERRQKETREDPVSEY
jgi:hypothetical protein